MYDNFLSQFSMNLNYVKF